MKYINMFNEGDNVSGVYLCKARNSAITKNGKDYENVTFTDKTGTIIGKIWDPGSMGIGDFAANDYVEVVGKVSSFNDMLQLRVDRAFKASEGSYLPEDYLPVSKFDIEEMWSKLLRLVISVEAPYYRSLLESFFADEDFAKTFKLNSAAKSVHHSFSGGLLQHTLSVAQICDFFADHYRFFDRDLLITGAILHDIGKTRELSDFPENDYTDEGQLLGHITIGAGMIMEKAKTIPDFPEVKLNELLHLILSHHGELEFGSPKVPALIEAVALSFADNADAKLEVFNSLLENSVSVSEDWLGFNKFLGTSVRKTK